MSSRSIRSLLLTPKPNRLRPPRSLSLPYTYTKSLTRILQSLNILRIIHSSILNTPFPLSNSLLLFTSITQTPLAPLLLPFLLLLNARSLPFTWTFRVLWCVMKVRTTYGVAWACAWGRYVGRYLRALPRTDVLKSFGVEPFTRSNSLTHLRLSEMETWLESVTPVGAHPFEWEGRYDTWVGPDDSDFNMHMSNSSYPKVRFDNPYFRVWILDFARTKASLELFPQFLRVGGHVALSSTHFHFINELPLFSKYQIRLSIGAWDEKWCYIVCRFVTVANSKRTNTNSNSKTSKPRNTNIPRILIQPPTPFVQSLSPPSPAPSSSSSPSPPASSSNSSSKSSSSTLPTDESDAPNGVKLHTIAVSRICFKHGRITVPPAIVFATNGVSVHPWEVEVDAEPTSTAMDAPLTPPSTPPMSPSTLSPTPRPPSPSLPPRFSHSNPPPSWTHHARPLIDKTQRGSEAKLREFYRGGWRDWVDIDPSSIWHAEPSSSSSSSSGIDTPSSFNSNSNSTSPISSNSSDTDTNSSDYPSSPGTPTTPPTPITPFDESDVTLPTPLTPPKSTTQTQLPPPKWWDRATATGTNTSADETRKIRLESVRWNRLELGLPPEIVLGSLSPDFPSTYTSYERLNTNAPAGRPGVTYEQP
ncbi:hypothetical protein F5876DRAFT_72317 [Lentinula aff. lateritia]|uniref:Uncharacterized protein n=1 Tax=Lentinula aff. lateritia TaxID=2804960 RepID=A0ACC1UE24_9AGAR|nr:hypothetical protein F5876DRAFT_72317 [Lentinula aff. lateritia]